MDKFSALRAFVEVAEAGGFSSAGRRLELAASSVVRAVDALEASLGTVLLNRTTRQVTLSDAGAVYYARAKQLLEELAEADALVADRGDEPSGPLRVSVPVAYGVRRIAPHVAAFLARYPKLDLDLQLTDERVDLVTGRIDVAIRLGEAAPSAEVVARPLGAFHRYVVASHDYLDAHGTPATPGELVDHECLRFHFGGDQQAWAFADAHGTTRVLVTGRLKSNHSEVLREAALDSAGIALLPDWLIDADVQSGRLRRLFEQYDVTPDTARSVVTALYLPNQRGSKRVAAFIDFVETLARAQH
ncbi:LysR family transcriptional regulator [Burkholderia pseudomultivorans]|uniref:HTH-type transcriptional regulator DmlR n=1 Tax=Burkholderia pseudomultivorans TaxID=1207504 RepID=A0ABU2E0L4_9BURK|nr:LysR family transcriptional regulator [Burkholderia pseudomultivorans]MDR8726858.1 HTH-type transcriptional regulator DmlR [Burkholderia pseudomultivorans]MDR8736037.1 HTH-type transcriptional regulator DmlR [Burkholderia pseudomultivorans]MDR8742013.1 HTH-type transcriptional regulator DmlR [Burkholderia pseudomultivorans]MDR8753188.1 HTH-type transcriptional regulator DmlR [Burkholderia pseudomultivorans]MDR8778607.1 HTH-type transcriptional regulator DmlR [Burkholderia pseudomultivorans]